MVGLAVGFIVGLTLVGSEAFSYWSRTNVFPVIDRPKEGSVPVLFAFVPVITACGGVIGLLSVLKPSVLAYALIGGLVGAVAETFASVTLPLNRPYLGPTTILDEKTMLFALLGAGGGVILWGLSWVRRRTR